MPEAKPKTDVPSVLAELQRLGQPRIREEMSTRYGILTRDETFGVRMSDMQGVAKKLGRNHALALALWRTGNYEARMVSAMVADPGQVTPALMDRWCRDFDNWAICDTVCCKLFDRTPHAFAKIAQWATRRAEFEKRAAFALLAGVAIHDKHMEESAFEKCLPLIEAAATDKRNFVKKGVNWALRAVGRRGGRLKVASIALAKRLAASPDAAPRWVGRDALRFLNK
jgi:3-methyladenine DNA glycosylase AlkD